MLRQVLWMSPSAMIDSVHTSIIVLWLMNLFGKIGHATRLDQWGLQNRSRPRQFLWLMEHEHCCLLILVVRHLLSSTFRASQCLAPTSAIFNVLFVRIRGFAFWRAWSECMNHRTSAETRNFSRGDQSLFLYHRWMKCSVSFSVDRIRKNEADMCGKCTAVWCDSSTWILYYLWRFE